MTVTRQGFCLGCGRSDLEVEVPSSRYKAIPSVAHPTWCTSPKCLEAKKAFDRVADNIIYKELRRGNC
jgi:hypothetical protein